MTTTHRYRLLAATTICFVFLVCLHGGGDAAPYSSYTYDFWKNDVPAPQAYTAARSISGASLGIGDFRDLRDIYVDSHQNVYILDNGNRRIVKLNSDLSVVRVIEKLHYSDGTIDSLNGASGLFVRDDGNIYVADTGNRRVVEIDDDGKIIKVYGEPRSDVDGVIPESFQYYPTRLCVDKSGRLYVVVKGAVDGLLEFSEDGAFQRFFGAPRVTPSLSDIFWSKVATREQRQRMALFLPTEYSSVDMDDRGFLFLTIAEGELAATEPIRYLSPGGKSVLRTMGFTDPIGDPSPISPPRFVDVVARPDGLYSALELNSGRVFTYDSSGYLLYVFASRGRQFGAVDVPVAVECLVDKMLVIDGGTNRITVYEPTEYGQLIHRALHLYHKGDYEGSARTWEKVLELNANFDRAYSGIGLTKLMSEDFRSAMDYFRLGNDREMYSKAYRLYRKEMVSEYLSVVLTMILILLAIAYVCVKTGLGGWLSRSLRQQWCRLDKRLRSSSRTVAAAWEGMKSTGSGIAYSAYVVLHPFDGFWRIKNERQGRVSSSVLITLLGVVSFIATQQYTGFVFNPRDLREVNVYREGLTLLVPFVLWCITNWALTTLMNGKGNLRDIFIASSYALVPLVIVSVPMAVISNFLTMEEASFYYLFSAVPYVWALALLFIATMVVHDYDSVKALYTSVFTCVGIGIVLFAVAFVVVLVDQIMAFGGDIYREVVLRQ